MQAAWSWRKLAQYLAGHYWYMRVSAVVKQSIRLLVASIRPFRWRLGVMATNFRLSKPRFATEIACPKPTPALKGTVDPGTGRELIKSTNTHGLSLSVIAILDTGTHRKRTGKMEFQS